MPSSRIGPIEFYFGQESAAAEPLADSLVVQILQSPVELGLADEESVFQTSGTVWRAVETPRGDLILSGSPAMKVLVDASNLRIWYDNFGDAPAAKIMEHPFCHLMTGALLARLRRGGLVHSALVKGKEACAVMAGQSGAGKSTLSLLIERYAPQATMLTDERAAVFTRGDRLHASGTPWSGTANIAQPDEAPLGHVLFLEHADENRLTPLGKTEAATELFRCSFPTFWYRPGMEFALEFCIRIASKVPCMRFGFRPDESAVRFIEQKIGIWNV